MSLNRWFRTKHWKRKKLKDYQNPCNPLDVPPQYKSRAESRGDTAKQEQEAITNLQSLFDFDVRDIHLIMSDIRKVRNEGAIIVFNALFQQILNRKYCESNQSKSIDSSVILLGNSLFKQKIQSHRQEWKVTSSVMLLMI